MSSPSQTGLPARRSALYLMEQVLTRHRMLSEVIADGALDRLTPGERATAQRLASETLRNLARADRLLQPHLRKAPPALVRTILRLGAVELAQGGAAHGVVNTYVGLTRSNKRIASLGGLVNAVLRKVSENVETQWRKLPIPALPGWLRKPLVQAWGNSAVQGFEVSHLRGAPVDLTLARPGEGALWADKLNATLLPTGSLRLTAPAQISALPGFEGGAWWVQDCAAALPVRLLSPSPGERILDLCAAPGGKTMQLAAAGADVTALDLSEERMKRVEENLGRTGLHARVITGDAMDYSEGGYDAVVLDAPCSATGTIRRHPDLPHARDGGEIGGLIALQEAMIDHALTLLRPGGKLVFCTCSLLPDEGECQGEAALERHPSLKAVAPEAPGIDSAWITEEGGVRLRPDFWSELGGMDGFYMICLQKAE